MTEREELLELLQRQHTDDPRENRTEGRQPFQGRSTARKLDTALSTASDRRASRADAMLGGSIDGDEAAQLHP
ncbi:hypothetical protein [Nocardioides sp. HB32]